MTTDLDKAIEEIQGMIHLWKQQPRNNYGSKPYENILAQLMKFKALQDTLLFFKDTLMSQTRITHNSDN